MIWKKKNFVKGWEEDTMKHDDPSLYKQTAA